jgi:predicted alpha/beta hydrolase
VTAQFVDLRIAARDGYPLAARLWSGTTGPFVALINAGAGIATPYYERFAAFLAENGVPTLVYDYRGIGRSRPLHLRGFDASVEEWGSKDCAAVIDWLRARFPSSRRLLIGHSVGGFVTGFASNGDLIDRMLLVGAHTGFWGDYERRARPWMFALWHLFMPTVTSLVGYFPGRAFHLGDDLPAGVAREWASRRRGDFWWNLRNADGTPDEARRDALLAGFHRVRARTLALRFTDDAFATDAATRRILG